MNVLIIGSGGREHALAWAIARSPELDHLICAPGNGGIAEVAECAALEIGDNGAVTRFCRERGIDLVVIGPEAPLANGLADALEEAGIAVFGPGREAARLESSKRFTKDLCRQYDIPTARFESFDNAEAAKAYILEQGAPIVIKADGLAAGKGVILASTEQEALAAIDDMFAGAFGTAGHEVVIEEYLTGEEASFFALTDGETVLPLATAQDHKRVGDGDTGLNTGGMGAYSPAPVMDEAMCQRVMDEIILPTVEAMKAAGTPYKGVLFAGLMITAEGPSLIEYNARFGDPECQALMMRLDSDLLPVLKAVADGKLAGRELSWKSEPALTVVMATTGYPGAYENNSEIRNLEAAMADPNVEIFHAGTKRENGRLLANGGRVLNVTALGDTVRYAQTRAYMAIEQIDWPQGFCRHDIGWRAVNREQANGR
ncbi:MAG: phosphoribosylamine--glycine ligase [Hyphomicrobiales bacterium]|nr:MAG: phosphoribosylamine--glycine ligase [Hyphomicrobiales bacterium]